MGNTCAQGNAGKNHFKEHYMLGDKLGEGGFAIVREGKHRKSEKSFAIKICMKAKLDRVTELALKDEIKILEELNYTHIIRLYDVFEESKFYYLVTEKMSGGELFDRIVKKSHYNEKEARDCCKILFNALQYCHARKVAHRDLKPENLLLSSLTDDTTIKIADFGFAKKVERPGSLTTRLGTPGYIAPEILKGDSYDTQVDMWSIGVIMYTMLGGYPPFTGNDQKKLFMQIRKGDYEFHVAYWSKISQDAKDLIRSLLTLNPAKRVTAEGALKDKWIVGDDAMLASQDLGLNLVEFKKFNARRKLKGMIKAVVASNVLKGALVDLKTNGAA